MDTIFLVAIIVLVVAVAVLFLMVLALAREIGRVQVRLGPLGARMMDTGPKIEQAGPSFRGLTDHVGRTVGVGGHRDRPQLLLFTAPTCSTCKSLLPGIRAMAKAEKDLDVVIVSDGTPEEHRQFLAGSNIGTELSYVDGRDVGIAYQVGTTPYGVILDEHGRIRAKGLCNHMAQVESLLNALETGTPSLQHLHEQAKARAAASA
ncbi:MULTISPECIES: redoxin domain-containing protein [Rhodococcus]|uniref:Methylamine utilization protein MauD n=1 Tax=Rhodococcus aetherivorans TaxID=191292 RepID=A0A059MVF1_9NOCA|nr:MULTISPECIES: redoxin domain-containing protein [Rhodococcus]ETT24711.1 alkyl hydroperoxide reductase/ Thiol specific antioxidant/ Mal allergen [Rhodococcus rhodochrous ATCC 21198]NCL76470.1 Methylamine utilization protein MauD [Rhodococcus sp. YH1]AKE88690.1 methylamine utilization protein [Rhodococcus aetherivorans]KDE14851.1 methylamine utilization protein [Rhodococcus aetherivorans]MBC2591657.1 redoxin domain-containing protein [Rhodococcus aetherivorans]